MRERNRPDAADRPRWDSTPPLTQGLPSFPAGRRSTGGASLARERGAPYIEPGGCQVDPVNDAELAMRGVNRSGETAAIDSECAISVTRPTWSGGGRCRSPSTTSRGHRPGFTGGRLEAVALSVGGPLPGGWCWTSSCAERGWWPSPSSDKLPELRPREALLPLPGGDRRSSGPRGRRSLERTAWPRWSSMWMGALSAWWGSDPGRGEGLGAGGAGGADPLPPGGAIIWTSPPTGGPGAALCQRRLLLRKPPREGSMP